MISPSDLLKVLRSNGSLPLLDPSWRSRFYQLSSSKRPLGWINKHLYLTQLKELPELSVNDDGIILNENIKQLGMDLLVQKIHEKKIFSGWRGENYEARFLDGEQERLFLVERSFARVFGLVRHSVHVNGYVIQKSDNTISNNKNEKLCWMGKRSSTKSRYPSMLDNVVAGGLTAGLSPFECAVKECYEEASIEKHIAESRLISTGSITRILEEDNFMSIEEIFIFDIDMTGIIPKPFDGEVESFSLMKCQDIIGKDVSLVKPDVLVIVTDFMIRHGMITSSQDPNGYLELIRALHVPIPNHI